MRTPWIHPGLGYALQLAELRELIHARMGDR